MGDKLRSQSWVTEALPYQCYNFTCEIINYGWNFATKLRSNLSPMILSVEFHLCMKGYSWRESRAKIVAIVKTKLQVLLGKNTLEVNKFTENECLPHFQPKWKPLKTLKTMRKRIDIAFKGFPLFAHWCDSQKQKTYSFARVALAYAIQEKCTAWRVNSTPLRDSCDIGFSRKI